MSSSSRDEILGKIRKARGRSGPIEGSERDRLDARLKSRPRGIIPQKARNTGAALVQDFVIRAKGVEATVQDISALSEIPDAVATYLAPHADLAQIDWGQRPTLTVSEGRSFGQDKVSLTRAFAGIAETGTLMLLAGSDAPTTLNFLPEHHIVVLKRSEIVGAYEDAWDKLRDQVGPDGILSRVVNMITGPSRTGDIEQTIELGAHGPLGLHILVLAD